MNTLTLGKSLSTERYFRLQMPSKVKNMNETNLAKKIYDRLSTNVSIAVTKSYSTSFSLGILCIDKSIRNAIYQIYGFVRIADEIVDTFHGYDKESLLNEFEKDTYLAIERKISTNPVLNSFQEVVNRYHIDHTLIDAFLKSMRMDLDSKEYKKKDYDTYIYGSAEVVGLMCLQVFVEGDKNEYERLTPGAKMLGSAFQKINFLRDFNSDALDLGRIYFPNVNLSLFDDKIKHQLLDEIDLEFDQAFLAIKKLPINAQFGVYVAYIYYKNLSTTIRKMDAAKLLSERARISNLHKIWLLIISFLKYHCGKI